MMSSRTGPGAGARRSLLMLPLLGPGRRICGGICRSCCSSRRTAAANACRCCRSRARSTGRTCACTVGRHGMFPGGRLRMMIMMTRRVIIVATAARVRVVMMGSTSTAGRCICVREAAGAAIVIVRIRRGRSGAVSGQRTRRCHRSRRGGEGGHLSMKWTALRWPVGRRARDLSRFVLFVMPKQSRRQRARADGGENPRDTF